MEIDSTIFSTKFSFDLWQQSHLHRLLVNSEERPSSQVNASSPNRITVTSQDCNSLERSGAKLFSVFGLGCGWVYCTILIFFDLADVLVPGVFYPMQLMQLIQHLVLDEK
jgi:hypothetical protein